MAKAKMHKLKMRGGQVIQITFCERLYPGQAQFAQRYWPGVTCLACKNVRDKWHRATGHN